MNGGFPRVLQYSPYGFGCMFKGSAIILRVRLGSELGSAAWNRARLGSPKILLNSEVPRLAVLEAFSYRFGHFRWISAITGFSGLPSLRVRLISLRVR